MSSSRIKELKAEIESFNPENTEALENFRIRFTGKKGVIPDLFKEMKSVAPESRKEFGQQINELKNLAIDKIDHYKKQLEDSEAVSGHVPSDLSLDPASHDLGSRHPISIIRSEIVDIFGRIGFTITEGREIEDEWHNFTALNTPEDHPARDMQDTFYLQSDPVMLLRTQTSSVQARTLENTQPPVRSVFPGRVYRNETISARAHCFFHQVEGLYVDVNVSFAELKQTLFYFARQMFGQDVSIRFRPSYFPFTEPSAEMDISCFICEGAGCPVCKNTGWVEILGCGMVDPVVLENCKVDSSTYTGFAFGMGIERIAMLKYQINDIRLFSENDVRFLKQFTHA